MGLLPVGCNPGPVFGESLMEDGGPEDGIFDIEEVEMRSRT
jgi:hypothetical protein